MGLTACFSLIKNWSDYHSEFKRICENSELSDTQRPQLKCQYNNDVTNCTERKLKIYISHQRDEATTCKLDFADIFSRSNGICFFSSANTKFSFASFNASNLNFLHDQNYLTISKLFLACGVK